MCDTTPTQTLVVHGTSQDMSSSNETTVKVVNQKRSEGSPVVELAGPGSTERSLGPVRPSGSHMGDEFGEIPLDYMKELAAGVVYGSGMDDITDEALQHFMEMVQTGQPIRLVGFSRGAVAIAKMLERAGGYMTGSGKPISEIRVVLLDPVPGPFGVSKHIVLPQFVTSLNLMTSKHEGRPGFAPLGLSLTGPARFSSDMLIGVHGDVGGSTGSPLSRIVLDDVLRRTGCGGRNLLTPSDVEGIALDSLLNWTDYADKPKLTVREFDGEDGPWQPSARSDIEIPSTATLLALQRTAVGRIATNAVPPEFNDDIEPLIERELERPNFPVEALHRLLERRHQGPIQLMYNPPPQVDRRLRVVHPQPVRRMVPQFQSQVGTRVLGIVKRFLK